MKQLPIALYILALLGFFLPWSSLSCTIPGAGTVGIYQSGLQMVTKGYTEKKPDGGMGGGMGGMGGGMGGMDDTDEMAEDLEPAFLPVATVLLTLIALVLALKSSAAANLVGILAGASALIQMVIGFPLKKVIEGGGGGGELGMDPAEILAEMYHIEYGFWITVAASILAGILGFAGGSAAESPNTATATTAPPSSPAAAPAAPETVPPAAPAEPIAESTAEHEAEGDAADAGESEE